MNLLLDLAKESKLEAKIQDLFAGKKLNVTEDRAVRPDSNQIFTTGGPSIFVGAFPPHFLSMGQLP